ncbi:hypothetical protein [Streptomyces atratus]|uniref:hypothetical protein n=1 Tax=Streptomyces atratus TaxID=1893 RepID=UPI0016701CB8
MTEETGHTARMQEDRALPGYRFAVLDRRDQAAIARPVQIGSSTMPSVGRGAGGERCTAGPLEFAYLVSAAAQAGEVIAFDAQVTRAWTNGPGRPWHGLESGRPGSEYRSLRGTAVRGHRHRSSPALPSCVSSDHAATAVTARTLEAFGVGDSGYGSCTFRSSEAMASIRSPHPKSLP